MNRIFHPNIDELYVNLSNYIATQPKHILGGSSRYKDDANLVSSGSVCLDVINQTWSPMFDMINIFEVFLPQLLRYPNPTDPLNGEAAALLMRDSKSYDAKVKGSWTATYSLKLHHTRESLARVRKQAYTYAPNRIRI